MTIADWIGDPEYLLGSLGRLSLINAAMVTMAELGVADHMSESFVPCERLAKACNADEDSLGRILRFLASEGLVRMNEEGMVAHSEYSRMLQSGHPLMVKEQLAVSANHEALIMTAQGVRSGEIPFNIRFGKSYFEYLAEHPELARTFGEYMSVMTRVTEDAIFAAHAFRPFRLAVDIGGSHGTMLRRLLKDEPAANGIIFDLPHVVQEAQGYFAAAPDANRISAIGGNFFEAVPEGADLYVLKQILHDWNDTDCITILRNIGRAMADGGRVAVIDIMLPETPTPHPGWAMDLMMMCLTGGRERKRYEFERLFDQAGYAIDAVTSTGSALSIIEAVRVSGN